MGTDGNRFVVVNSVGREIEELQKEDPVDGKRLQLTIDYDVQHALEEGFKSNGFAGAGVLLDPRNGEVLALTSQPAYDPNDFADRHRSQRSGPSSTPIRRSRSRIG